MAALSLPKSKSEEPIGAVRLLVIDDNRAESEPLCRLLKRAGYEVRTVNDSRVALRSAVEFQPHVVILDFLMPELHGGDVAWQLSSSSELSHAKVIVASAYPSEEIRRKLPPAKIPILPKPIDVEELMHLIADIRG